MSRFDATFLTFASPTIECEFGETITLSDGVNTFAPTATVTNEIIERRQEETGLVIVYSRRATVTNATAELLSGGKPKVGLTAAIGGVTYDVEDVKADGNSMTLSLVRYQIRERSRQNYRGR